MVIANAGGRTLRDIIISCLERLVPVPNFISVRMAQIYAAEATQHFALVKPWDERTASEGKVFWSNSHAQSPCDRKICFRSSVYKKGST